MSSGGPGDGVRMAEAAKRIIRPRRVWPGGRAVVGGLLVAVAALGLLAAFQGAGDTPTTTYVVARVDIAPGQVVTADMVGFQPMGLPEAVATGAFGEGSEDEVLGSVAIGPVGAGELLQRSSVRAAGTVDRSPYEVSFQIDAARALNGALRPGERVDVIATTGVGSTAVTERILDDAIVIGVGAPPSASLVTSDVVVTVALDDADAVLRLSTAADTGQLTLVRRVGS